jgi:hypothetical protein
MEGLILLRCRTDHARVESNREEWMAGEYLRQKWWIEGEPYGVGEI